MAAPPGAAIEQLRACRSEQEQRPTHLPDHRLEQVQKVVLRPMYVLDEDDGRPVSHELAHELRPYVEVRHRPDRLSTREQDELRRVTDHPRSLRHVS